MSISVIIKYQVPVKEPQVIKIKMVIYFLFLTITKMTSHKLDRFILGIKTRLLMVLDSK